MITEDFDVSARNERIQVMKGDPPQSLGVNPQIIIRETMETDEPEVGDEEHQK